MLFSKKKKDPQNERTGKNHNRFSSGFVDTDEPYTTIIGFGVQCLTERWMSFCFVLFAIVKDYRILFSAIECCALSIHSAKRLQIDF